MGTFRPPDIIYLVLTAAVAAGLALVLAIAARQQSVHLQAIEIVSIAYVVFATISWVPWHYLGVRERGYRLYYRFFGPTCTINVWASLEVDANVCEKAFLDQVYDAAKRIISSARVTLQGDNQIDIRVGAQTLTATVVTRPKEEPEWGEEDEHEEEVEKSLTLTLGGYEGHITGMDDVLSRRVLPLLEGLYDLREKRCPANLSLQAQLTAENPFLVFYLRDMAASHITDFNMHLRLRDPVRDVNVTADAISVGAATPSGADQRGAA